LADDKESIDFIENSICEIESKNTLILYETSNTVIAIELMKKLNENNQLNRNFSLAKINSISSKWNFTNSVRSLIESKNSESNDSSIIFGPFLISEDIRNFDLVIYLGQCLSLNLTLNCNNLLEIDINNKKKRSISSSKELRKRVSKIEKFKEKSCALIGIIFTNPLPNVDDFSAQSKRLAKKLKKKVYFISLVQTLDEYKLGNFGQLNAFVIVNSCWCSSVLNSLNYCYPVLNWTEFEIAAGLKRSYGGVHWNDETLQANDSDSDEIELNPNSSQLIETEIFNRNKWFGLEVDSGSKEASLIKSGQKGIASYYENEDHF
jgi:diphthamide biosynthesis enzyme Dph1/Dph2-like protein